MLFFAALSHIFIITCFAYEKTVISTHEIALKEIKKTAFSTPKKKQPIVYDELSVNLAQSITSVENFNVGSSITKNEHNTTKLELGYSRWAPNGIINIAGNTYNLKDLGKLDSVDLSVGKLIVNKNRNQVWFTGQIGMATQKVNIALSNQTVLKNISQLYLVPSFKLDYVYKMTKFLSIGASPEVAAILLTQSSNESSIVNQSQIGALGRVEGFILSDLGSSIHLQIGARFIETTSLRATLGWSW